MIKPGHKDGRRNHGGPRRGANYVSRYYKNSNSNHHSAAAENRRTEAAKPLASKEYGKLTRSVLLGLYANSPSPFDAIKELKEVYSEESIEPEGKKEFNLPMDKAIMPPRRPNMHEGKEAYHKEEEEGIFKGANASHSSMTNAPVWFDSEVAAEKAKDSKAEETFSMESLASRQVSLEEEKARFNRSAGNGTEQMGTKVTPGSLFADAENGYSSVDVKYESSLKGTNRIAQELFANPTTESSENVKAIDVGNLEAQMFKTMKQEEMEKEENEEVPIWDAYSAEEIKQQSEEDFGTWGQSLNTAEQPYAERYPDNELPAENANPFCHSSLTIKETDRVWYYRDTQNAVQGPFNSVEMNTWHKAGYFPANLLLKCGKYSPFTPLADFLNFIRAGQRSTSAHHFDGGSTRFFTPTTAPDSSFAAAPTLSLAELESGFIPAQSSGRGNCVPQPHLLDVQRDPAIASLGTGRSEVFADTVHVRDEAYDLKALLGMQGNYGTQYR